jgi:hypothetical protein
MPGIAVRRTASLPLAYDPAIYVFACGWHGKTWMPGIRLRQGFGGFGASPP